MGYNTDVYIFNWVDAVDVLMEGGCDNRYVIEKLFYMYGARVGNNLLILSDDDRGDSDPAYSLYITLERLFDVGECGELLFTADHKRFTGYEGSYNDAEVEIENLRKLLIHSTM